MRIYGLLMLLFTAGAVRAQSQACGWQQDAHYTIDAELDTRTHRLSGREKIQYTNHAPDTLHALYLNLYVNAFRKHSRMRQYQDERYRAFGGSLLGYYPDYILGNMEILGVYDGQGRVLFDEEDDTILKVSLREPLAPGGRVTVYIEFEETVPFLIRRMGRRNREGIDYSMAQWYPKLCVYDRNGWHLDTYLGREFYGEFATYEVSLTLPEAYVIGATGTLVNASSPGAMMQIPADSTRRDRLDEQTRVPSYPAVDNPDQPDTLLNQNHELEELLSRFSSLSTEMASGGQRTWRFRAERVHDFAWCADPDYRYDSVLCGPTRVHFLYLPSVARQWERMKEWTGAILDYMNAHVGPYPYPDLTIAQAGDGGMEYPSIAFITGNRPPYSLASVTAHEVIHNWFYGALANDEVHEAWMDEGITSYYTTRVMNTLFGRYAMRDYGTPFKQKHYPNEDALVSTFASYEWWAKQGWEEKTLTHSDRFISDESYAYSVYTKGHVFMNVLEYYFGREAFDRLMRRYYETHAFTHVSTDGFRRFLEQESGTELEWLFEQWLGTTRTCDYGIRDIDGRWVVEGGRRFYAAEIHLRRYGLIEMPLDVVVTLKNKSQYGYRIPAHMLDADKPGLERRPVWDFSTRAYTLILELDDAIESVAIDTSRMMPDANRRDNATGLWNKFEMHIQKPVSYYPTLDTYVLTHRPSVWYNSPDGLRAGYRAHGRWATDEYRLRAGAYYGVKSRRPDYELILATPLYNLGRQTEMELTSLRLEGRSAHSLGLNKKWFVNAYDYPPYHQTSARIIYSRLFDADYLPRGISWDKGDVQSLQIEYRYRSRYFNSPQAAIGFETSVWKSDWRFSKISFSYYHPVELVRWYLTLNLRTYAGYAVGDVPAQAQFYLAGASPQEMFHQRFFRSAGTVPASLWQNRSARHWYADGGGSMSGYYNANIAANKIWTNNLDLYMANPLKRMFRQDLLLLTHSRPFLFFDGGLTWEHNRDLTDTFKKRWLSDAGAGMVYDLNMIPDWWGIYQLRFEIPFWVSRPSLNHGDTRTFKIRWLVGLYNSF